MNHEGGKLWRRWKGRVELLPSKLFQILMPYQVQEVRTPYWRLKLARTRKEETAAATPQHRDAPAEAPRQGGWGADD